MFIRNTGKFLASLYLLAISIFGASSHAATPIANQPKVSLGSYDLHNQYVWQPVRIGAGGWVRGMVIHPASSAIRYARSDTWAAYRWDAIRSVWVPMLTTQSLPPSIKTSSTNDLSKTFQLTGFPSEAGVDSIAIDPQNQSRVYLSWGASPPDDITGGPFPRTGNVYYSNDFGRTFAASTGLTSLAPRFCSNPRSTSLYDRDSELNADDFSGERMRVDPRNSNLIYLGSRLNGVFVSADAARSFSHITGGGVPTGCNSVTNIFFDGSATVQRTINGSSQTISKTIYIVVSYNWNNGTKGKIFKSSDGGVTWNDIAASQSGLTSSLLDHSVLDQTGTLWVTANGQLFKYQNNKWVSQPQPPRGVQDVAIDPNNPQRIFTTNGDLQSARSLDGGAHWTNLGRIDNTPLLITSSDGINWISARRTRPTAHGAFLFDSSVSTAGGRGRLWVSNGNDGTIYADLNDAKQTDETHGLSWFEKSQGIEQLVSQNVLLPPGNNNSALITVDDEAAFYISNPRLFTAKRYDIDTTIGGNNDLVTNGMAAYIPDTPSVMVTIPSNLFLINFNGGPRNNNYPGYSTNYGKNWTLFSSVQQSATGSVNNPDVLFGGQIAISARGTVLPKAGQPVWTGQDNIVWLPYGNNTDQGFALPNTAPRYSLDGGVSWKSGAIFGENGQALPFDCSIAIDPNCLPFPFIFGSASKQFATVADPITPKTFYAVTQSSFMRTTDGGMNWNIPPGTEATFRGKNFFIQAKLAAVPGKSGDLWIASGSGDLTTSGILYHSTNGGLQWQQLPLSKIYNVAVGKGAPGKDYALYVYGQPIAGQAYGVYRSDDRGITWLLISGDGTNGYPNRNFNLASDIAASQDVEGLVYLSLRGQSAVWGYKRSLGNPYPFK